MIAARAVTAWAYSINIFGLFTPSEVLLTYIELTTKRKLTLMSRSQRETHQVRASQILTGALVISAVSAAAAITLAAVSTPEVSPVNSAVSVADTNSSIMLPIIPGQPGVPNNPDWPNVADNLDDVESTGGENGSSPAEAAEVSTLTETIVPDIAKAVTTGHGALNEKVAANLISSYHRAAASMRPDTVDVQAKIKDIAGPKIATELEARLLELHSNGWKTTGTAVVKSVIINSSDPNANPPTALVEACIDSVNVRIIDTAGKPVGHPSPHSRARSLYTFEQRSDGAWIISFHSFPNNPAC